MGNFSFKLYEVLSIAYTAISLLIAWFVSPVLANMYPLIKVETLSNELSLINKVININSLLDTIVYFVIVFFVLKLLYLIISLIVKSFNKVPVLGTINKILGGVCGIINATLVTLAISLLFTLPIFKNGSEIREKTVLKYVDTYSTKALELFVENIDLNKYVVDSSFDVDLARDGLKEWLTSLKDE